MMVSEGEVEAEGIVEAGHEVDGNLADQAANSLDGDRPDLLGLGLGVTIETGIASGQQHLKWVDPLGVGCDGYNGDHSVSQAGGCGIGLVVADDYRRARPSSFSTDSGAEVDDADFSSTHRRYARPSETAESQRWLSSLSHCSKASA